MGNAIIEIQDVWKRYYLNSDNRPKSLKSALMSGLNYYTRREPYWALQGINLNIEKGKTIGLIGNNGAGKSTLLRLISGLSRPTRGKILQSGRVGSLLELGAGFNYEFTGRENVITGSILAGLTRKEAEARLDQVIEFAELQDFVDVPVRTYSSGMFVRLAFATEINLDPDILLVDEVLAVGDIAFQKKCLNYLENVRSNGKTIIVVSHVMSHIENMCDEVIWLDNGKIRVQGKPYEVVEQYRNRLLINTEKKIEEKQLAKTLTGTAPKRNTRKGTHEIEIASATLLNEAGNPTTSLESGNPLHLQINLTAEKEVDNPVLQVNIFNNDGIKCSEITTQTDNVSLPLVPGTSTINLHFLSLPLVKGSYFFSIGVYPENWEYIYDYNHQAVEFTVNSGPNVKGILVPPHRWLL